MATSWWALLLLTATSWLSAADLGVKAYLVGGTVASLPQKADGYINLTGEGALSFVCKGNALSIAYDKVNTLEYGQRVSRRFAEAILISPVLLLSKSRKHFVTIGYTDEEGHQQALVFRVSKGDVRTVLAGLEAKTGRRVEYQDDEARKSGKG
ncbi:MAG TPA: hypothetical protein VG672_27500 [Bryobacteraceae bacterium]|jgi:hypothetical protein|nr:hypothetical protein [Bryobacteraceae bacterium]